MLIGTERMWMVRCQLHWLLLLWGGTAPHGCWRAERRQAKETCSTAPDCVSGRRSKILRSFLFVLAVSCFGVSVAYVVQ